MSFFFFEVICFINSPIFEAARLCAELAYQPHCTFTFNRSDGLVPSTHRDLWADLLCSEGKLVQEPVSPQLPPRLQPSHWATLLCSCEECAEFICQHPFAL